MRSVQRSGQQLFGVWSSYPPSTPGYASCILFKVFHEISFLSYIRYFWLCTMSLFFIQQYIVAKTIASFWLNFRMQSTLHHNPILTLHLLLNSQLVTRDELTYWRVDQTLTSAGCPLLPYRFIVAFWSTANRGSKGISGDAQWVMEILGRQGNGAGNIPFCFKGK